MEMESTKTALTATKKPRGKGRPWPKGVSGNPKGNPALGNIEKLRHQLIKQCTETKNLDRLVNRLIEKGITGTTADCQLLLYYVLGKAKTEVELSGTVKLSPEEAKARVFSMFGIDNN